MRPQGRFFCLKWVANIDKQQYLLVFIHSLYRYIGPNKRGVNQAIHCYRLAGGEAI
ncbi:MAG: hypothetical protein ACJAZA_000367 [Shewanella psychromarinicola]|jgi:hypothetical protein